MNKLNDSQFEGYYDIAEILSEQYNAFSLSLGLDDELYPEDIEPTLRNSITPESLNVFILTDFGRGLLMGHVIKELTQQPEDQDNAEEIY